MKVYLVHHGEYSDYTVDAIFIDEDIAKEYCDLHNKYDNFYGNTYEYEEWDTIECRINMQKDKNRIGYLYHFDKNGHLKEEGNPKLRIQWREDGEVHASIDGYLVTIFANDRSEAQCRKIACDKVAAYRAIKEFNL